jgi:hypothetical protein
MYPSSEPSEKKAPMSVMNGEDGFVSASKSKLKEKHSADCFTMFDQEAITAQCLMHDRICSEHHKQLLAYTVQKLTCLVSTFADFLS